MVTVVAGVTKHGRDPARYSERDKWSSPTQFPQKLQRTKEGLTYERFTLGKWHTAASCKKSPAPMGVSPLDA